MEVLSFPHNRFLSMNIFLLSFKTKAVSCDNIQTTLGKTLMSNCDINFFEKKVVFLEISLLLSCVGPGIHL